MSVYLSVCMNVETSVIIKVTDIKPYKKVSVYQTLMKFVFQIAHCPRKLIFLDYYANY